MTLGLWPATTLRLEKVAPGRDFDRALPRQGDALGFESTRAARCPARGLNPMRMRTFAKGWPAADSVQRAVGQLPGAHKAPLSKPKEASRCSKRKATTAGVPIVWLRLSTKDQSMVDRAGRAPRKHVQTRIFSIGHRSSAAKLGPADGR